MVQEGGAPFGQEVLEEFSAQTKQQQKISQWFNNFLATDCVCFFLPFRFGWGKGGKHILEGALGDLEEGL